MNVEFEIEKVLEKFGLITPYGENELELEIQEIFQERGHFPDSDEFFEALLDTVSYAGDGRYLAVGNLEKMRKASGFEQPKNEYDEWIREGMIIRYDIQESKFHLGIPMRHIYAAESMQNKKYFEHSIMKKIDEKKWEEHKIKKIFHPKEAFRMILLNVQEALKQADVQMKQEGELKKLKDELAKVSEKIYEYEKKEREQNVKNTERINQLFEANGLQPIKEETVEKYLRRANRAFGFESFYSNFLFSIGEKGVQDKYKIGIKEESIFLKTLGREEGWSSRTKEFNEYLLMDFLLKYEKNIDFLPVAGWTLVMKEFKKITEQDDDFFKVVMGNTREAFLLKKTFEPRYTIEKKYNELTKSVELSRLAIADKNYWEEFNAKLEKEIKTIYDENKFGTWKERITVLKKGE